MIEQRVIGCVWFNLFQVENITASMHTILYMIKSFIYIIFLLITSIHLDHRVDLDTLRRIRNMYLDHCGELETCI